MSDERNPDTDSQAAPIPNDRPFIQDLVIADIEERKQFGIRKYGTALQAGNGRDMLLDAYEEALDLCIYLRGALEERNAETVDSDSVGAEYAELLNVIRSVGGRTAQDAAELVAGLARAGFLWEKT